MSGNPSLPATLRARPVAEAPVDALLGRAEELARDWASSLVSARPLERIGEVPLVELSREGAALCALLIRALASDQDLDRVARGPAADPREHPASARPLEALAFGGDAASAVQAVEALRGLLWEALLHELRGPALARTRTRLVGDLADRLACVCATALVAALGLPEAPERAGREATVTVVSPVSAQPAVSEPYRASPARRGVVLVDERDELLRDDQSAGAPGASATAQARTPRPDPQSATREPSRPLPGETSERPVPRPLPWETPLSKPSEPQEDGAPPSDTVEPEIHIRDERGEDGSERGEEAAPPWIVAIAHEVERFPRDQLPFAVLVVELGDAEGMRRSALPAGMLGLTSQVERVLGEGLELIGGGSTEGRRGRPGWLMSERPGRYWLLAPETDVPSAGRLAAWLMRAVRPLASRRWAALHVTIGTAVYPENGRDAQALAAHADAALSAARAAPRPGASVDEPV